MSEPEDAGKYQVDNDGPVQGQVVGDNATVHQHFYATQGKATSPTKPQRVWNIPYLRNDYFTGREDILAQMHTRFKAGNATALSQRHAMSGLGGIGKTQIAVQYAYEHCDEYQAVLWVHAESHEALTSSFVEIARLLDLPQKDEQDQTIIVQAVKCWLQENNGWLLILDNADEPKIVREFLPTKFDGHILLTTRAQTLGGLAQRIEVDSFTPELGALFLLRRATLITADGALEQATPEDREVAMQISEELGGLALALDQAGAYIEETRCSLSDYLKRYRTRRTAMLKRRGKNAHDYPASVATTWSLSFEQVKKRSAAAADLLRLCAFLAPDAIPEEIVVKGASHLGEHLQGMVEDEGLLDEAIAVLRAYSLLQRDPAEKTLSIHRLVQAVLCDAISEDETKLWAERTVLAVNESCPAVEFATWAQWERYLPHALVCAELIRQCLYRAEAALLLQQTGWYMMKRARYGEAKPLLEQALAMSEQVQGKEHLDTARDASTLALLHHTQGKDSEAELLFVRALEIYEQQLGPHHPDTANSLNNLAGLYQEQGKYAEAEPLYQRALHIHELQLGPHHPGTAISLNNLALLYHIQGKYSEAEPLFQRALHIHEKALGLLHPTTATSLDNLASLYRDQNKYSEAEPLFQQALAIYEKALGPLHPDTAISLNNLALLYDYQGKYQQVEPLYVRALSIDEKALGPDHPNTAISLNNLAGLYYNQGKYEQAEPLYARALHIRELQLGPHHPDTAQSLNNLAALYRSQGKYSQAEPLFQQALTIHELQLGPHHPDTATSLNNLAFLYHNQEKYSQAEPLYVRALEICEQQLGPHHPDTGNKLNNLAGLYQAQSKYSEAELLFQRALKICELQLGPHHPDTANRLHNLAGLYKDQGNYSQAEPLFQQALHIYEKALGPQHPHTQTARQNYAALLRAMGRGEEAKQLKEKQ